MDLIENRQLRTVFQPVVDLETSEVLGFEALLRDGEADRTPLELLAQAEAEGVITDLDFACRREAIRSALEARLGPGVTLFVNIELDHDGVGCAAADADLFDRAGAELRVVFEVTERHVVTSPAALLKTVDWARERSWGIAVDDIGTDPMSLAMMPFLEPDVIKLDLRLIHDRPTAEIGELVSSVLSQAERTGATILAEGVETPEHHEAALAMGATLGQGWLFGHPGPLPTGGDARLTRTIPLLRVGPPRAELTPFGVVRSVRPLRRGDRRLLEGVASHLEEQARIWHDNPVVLSTFHRGEALSTATAERYEALAASGSFVVVVRPDDPPTPWGVRGATFADDHRLADEWSVIVVGPHYAGALVARRLNDSSSPGGDGYDYAITHDRQLAIDAGRALLRQVEPISEPNHDPSVRGAATN